MTGLQIDSHKTLMLFSGRSFPELADEVAKELSCDVSPVKLYDFANGETYCRFEESIRGCDAFVMQSHHSRVNDWVVEQLIMCDALKRASAKRITVVVPFYPYSRQDKKTLPREPISAKLMADLFRTAGANRIIAIDLHTPQIQGYFDAPLDHLTALPLLSDYLADKLDLSQVTIVSPDTGRVRTAEKYTDRLGEEVNLAFVHKRRESGVPNEAKTFGIVGDVEGRTCVIVDDMIDTAGTITKAADALLARGATEVLCAATHAVFSGPAIDRLKNSQISEVIVTNTLPIDDDKRFDKLTVLSVAPMIAQAIQAVFDDSSVSSLFDGTTA